MFAVYRPKLLYFLLPFIIGCCSLACITVLPAQASAVFNDRKNDYLPDTIRLQLLDSLIRKVYWRKQVDSSFLLIDQQLEMGLEKGSRNWVTRAYKNRSDLFNRIGDYPNLIPATKDLIASYDSTQDMGLLAFAYQKIAYAQRKMGLDAASLNSYQISLRWADRAGKEGLRPKAAILNSLGSFYFNRREYDLAKEKYLASLALHRAIKRETGIYSNLNNLGLIHAKTGDYEKAIEYYEISLEMKKASGDKRRMANTLGSLGDIYVEWGRLEMAKKYFLEAKKLQEELGIRDELTRSLTQLGDLARAQGNPQQALEWCSQSCRIAEEDVLWQAALACHKCLYEAHKALGNTTTALSEYELYVAFKDSIFNDKNTREIAAMEAQLIYERQLSDANTEQMILRSTAARERLLRWVFVGLTIGLGLLSWFILWGSRMRRKQNEILQEKNIQIDTDRATILRQSNELAEMAKAKDRFFNNVSHELRTPLTLIVSPLEKLLKQNQGQLSAEVMGTLGTVQGNANKLLHLVEELLELAKLEGGTIAKEEQAVVIRPFLQQLFDNYRLLAQDKGIQYDFTFAGESDLVIQVGTRQLEKVIDNLLSNALKFTPAGGQVKITTSCIGNPVEELKVEVADTGPGIAPEDLEKIFDRYYQAVNEFEITPGGTGIGLALAQELANFLGGKILVKSESGKGSLFTLKIPVISGLHESEELHALGMDSSKLSGRRGRILIVEDHPELQSFLARALSEHECFLANNGLEALEALKRAKTKKEPIELLLTDLMMPEMDGTTLVQHIQANEQLRTTKIVILTARHSSMEKLNLLRIGVDDYLTKPFSTEELRLRIERLLTHPIENQVVDQGIEEEKTPPDTRWLKGVETQVERLLKSQQELTAGALASAMNLSNRQLLRKIKGATGLSTQLYIQECKLQLAHRYLNQHRFDNVTEIARASGFSTPAYFSKVFQERFGKAPSVFLH